MLLSGAMTVLQLTFSMVRMLMTGTKAKIACKHREIKLICHL